VLGNRIARIHFATNFCYPGFLVRVFNIRETSTIRIILVEDFLPYRTLISSLFAKTSDLQVVGEASNGTEAVEKTHQLMPDLVLIDIGLPELNGLEAARQIRSLNPSVKIVFLTEQADVDIVKEALALGAMGYVLKRRRRFFKAGVLSAPDCQIMGLDQPEARKRPINRELPDLAAFSRDYSRSLSGTGSQDLSGLKRSIFANSLSVEGPKSFS
jgi:CheY-like chemotaxis protein